MATKKKDLEIIYNLQWKNKPANGGDKANIIGMYDIPATTLNWEVFKSYLLKNSGTVGDDVKVSYITDSNREFPIESQTDFQIALYAFRRKSRLGDIVNLKLDRISDQPTHKNLRHSNDVETQSDNNEAVSLTSTCCNIETPPEWFVAYMNQFKKNITDELTTTVSTIVSNIKPHVVSQPSCYHSRKSKPECPKRVRKLAPLIAESSHETKDLLKSLKLEGKLERKLEKLEHKTKKIKEKKLALLTKSSDSDAGQSSSRSHSYRRVEKEDDLLQMDAAPVNTQSAVPHMLGGEVYLHQWEVMNTGKLPWTSKTSLNFTWGSKALKPLDTTISVPYLKPGQIGTLAVRLQIPDHPGQYECYFHFHHKERRFGHWLGCQVIVDPFDLKGNKSVLETSFVSEFISNPKKFKTTDPEYHDIDEAVTQYSEIFEEPPTSSPQKYTFNIEQDVKNDGAKPEETADDDDDTSRSLLKSLVRNISTRMDDMKLQDPTDTNCSSDSDNQSIVSLSESNSSKSLPEEFVVVPIPDCFKVDQEANTENVLGGDDKDLVTDSTAVSSSNKRVSEESVKADSEQASDNFDGNNNSEKVNQNSATGLLVKLDDSSSNDGSQKSDVVVISIPNKEEEDNAGYAYLIVDGHRLPIPKKILNSEYLKLADENASSSKESLTRTDSVASSVEMGIKKDDQQQSEAVPFSVPEQQVMSEGGDQKLDSDINGDLMSHCSAAGSCFSEAGPGSDKNSRLFIFPQSCPGFEVVYPVLDVSENSLQEYKWSESNTQYTFANSSAQTTTSASAPPLSPTAPNKNPFAAGSTVHVPNFQQTPPELRTAPPTATTTTAETTSIPTTQAAAGTPPPENVRAHENSPPIHILPETLVSGAVNVASSALNTARTVFNMIVPREPGRWVNGHWVSTSAETPREANLQALAEMGFWNRDLNATLLARYNDDLSRVVAELVQ
ncbi:uncharacterized protein LOC108911046 isoform X2 [Anoplophora glabripennis]|uniref:uncharacterized protein LOC108911046 isoform X2 n=1 Tax=Anoplophora glabripennis TaxID=217634 RepID=UPI000873AEA4|nr:uncharacterized protein LOC108911046 isoform X2 [Anoplophora glabripennis]